MSDTLAPLPSVEHQRAVFADGLALDCGMTIAPMAVAYRTYGRLNADASNAILICHALTGDQYVAEPHPVTGRDGWWKGVVGPGDAIDTDRFFVICANVLGGCMGSTGPREEMTDAEGRGLGRPWGTDFPAVTIRDMVRAQARLVEHLGITRLLAVVGGSMGGMQALEWAATFPGRVFACVAIATAAHHSAQNIAFDEVGRAAIHSDPDWKGGRYWEDGRIPARGLSVARMVAHITYLSEAALARKFGRRLQGAKALTFLEDVFQVESYLRHQGSTFVRRFDANSYLTITRAMDYFDLSAEHGGDLSLAFQGTQTRFLLTSFTSDWLFPTEEAREIVRALNKAAANVSFLEIASDKGHDAFLLDEPEFRHTLRGFLRGAAERLGV
ncbi:Homoserine O-acetyltransferase [Roseomonas mucosa]|uniref:Homoserine O-acetyltransferase n=1 Tax=Roseomonas mucosa TaxID=207340 RepID=A0A4Y1MTB6_9PROT|nr:MULTISPECIES: homoserine O-acetyltransferase [Roseomonas]MDT8264333.1 homoserine O-acetyltransferase [Roseomonas sp. DSM 102946]AWV21231.1 Homoserine O-acetyltransferase [Roseomonas mucosa]MDT8277414.1 homoserine O-acetyltransferase [Roseomonas mucosa]MDT8356294.1 homoserine O-acetyltransferase [Roseomonas mucosa]MDU7521423.1 homoserine O-acetyltransferase [Roseomonas mucosa]